MAHIIQYSETNRISSLSDNEAQTFLAELLNTLTHRTTTRDLTIEHSPSGTIQTIKYTSPTGSHIITLSPD